jgi:hypothetical protein
MLAALTMLRLAPRVLSQARHRGEEDRRSICRYITPEELVRFLMATPAEALRVLSDGEPLSCVLLGTRPAAAAAATTTAATAQLLRARSPPRAGALADQISFGEYVVQTTGLAATSTVSLSIAGSAWYT